MFGVLRFWVSGFRFEVWGFAVRGFRGSGFRVRVFGVLDFECRFSRFEVSCWGFGVSRFGVWVIGVSRFGVSCLGYGVFRGSGFSRSRL